MPTHRCLRPIILSAAYQLPPIPHRLLCSPITHQHHHRRTTATLRPPYRSQSYAFSAGSAIAAMFGAVLLCPQRSTNATNTVPSHVRDLYAHIVEECIEPELHKAFHEYLGCQDVKFEVLSLPSDAPDDVVAQFADLQMGLYLDADATSGDMKGTVLGLRLISRSREEKELIPRLRRFFEEYDKEGVLRKKGKAVCLIGCKGVDGIWVYGEERNEGWWWKVGIFRV